MNKLIYILLSSFLSIAVSATANEISLIGKWELSDEFANLVPDSCKDVYLEITNESFNTISGHQIIFAEYSASYRGKDTVIILSNITSNGQANCQGYSSDFVLNNFAELVIWRHEGAVVKVLAPQLLMELQRVPTP